MPEHSASLPVIDVVTWLWLAPALPLAGVLAVFATIRRAPILAGRVAVASALGAMVVLAIGAALLPGAGPRGLWLVDHVAVVLRAGALDATLGFVLEPVGALLGAAVALGGAGALAALRRAGPATGPSLGGALLAISASLVALLASDGILAVAGWAGVTLSAWLVTGSVEPRAGLRGFVLGATADSLALVGFGVLLYGASGEWTTADYTPAYRARIVGAQAEAAPGDGAPRGAAPSLTIVTLPGSRVTVDGATLCSERASGEAGGLASPSVPCRREARTPLARIPVAGGLRDVRVAPGAAADDVIAERVRIDAAAETHVVPAQGSLSFVDLLAAQRLRDGSGERVVRRQLARRTPWGTSAAGLAAFLLALAAMTKLAAAFCVRASGTGAIALLVGASGAGVAAVLPLRVAFLYDVAPGVGVVLTCAAAVAAAVAAVRAAVTAEPEKAIDGAGLAVLASALAAIGAGAPFPAAAGLLSAATGLGALRLAVAASAAPPSVAAGTLGALVVAGAPVPAALGFFAREGTLGASLASGPFAGSVAWGLLAAASGAVSYTVWRVQARLSMASPQAADRVAAGAALGLALVGIAGSALAFSDRAWGGTSPSPLASFASASFGVGVDRVAAAPGMRASQLALGFAAVLAGFWLGRRHGRDDVEPLAALRSAASSGFGAPALLDAVGRTLQIAAAAVARSDAALAGLAPSAAQGGAPPPSGPRTPIAAEPLDRSADEVPEATESPADHPPRRPTGTVKRPKRKGRRS